MITTLNTYPIPLNVISESRKLSVPDTVEQEEWIEEYYELAMSNNYFNR